MSTHGLGRKKRGSAMAEFGPVMWVFFVFILFPFLDLISFGSGVATVMFMANMTATQAATASTYTDAQKSALRTESQLVNFMKFAKLAPSNGANSGVNVQVMVSPLNNQAAGTMYQQPGTIPNQQPTNDPSNPDNPANPQPNTGNTVYQYVITAQYDVSPLFNFAHLPVLQDLPALGKPVPVKFVSTATVEHTDGLNS